MSTVSSNYTLWEVPANKQAHIVGFSEHLTGKLPQRLSEMGFTQGQYVECLRRTPFNGPIIVSVQDCVYSIDRNLAQSIHVGLIA